LKLILPDIAILIVSGYGYQPGLFAMIQAGVGGYILKKTAPRELLNAVRSLYTGKGVFNLNAITSLFRDLATDKGSTVATLGQLRPREIEVLKAAAKGISNKEIGSELSISERTVQTHLVNIFRKLNANSRTEAVLIALKEGLIKLDDLP
jgi:DNA-binding NarL/FixJ family response regulator